MKHVREIVFLWAGLGLNGIGHAQNYITNPGFEGPDGIELVPEGWLAGCGIMNTPDTQPGWWNIENKPYEGESYIDLLFKEDGTTESVYQQLETPLDSGACFLVQISLAQACQDSLSGLDSYELNHPGDLIIRGSAAYGCANGQLLAEFKQVSNCRWKEYYAVFQTHEQINYIYLEFSKGNSVFNNGSILIDHFVLENLHTLSGQPANVSFGEVVTLSASTPGTSHTWEIEDSVISADTTSVDLLITDNMAVNLSYFSEDGCLVEEHFVLLVTPEIPNTFTPLDQDAVNDVFFIRGLVEESKLYVYNRWGQLVFEQAPYSNGWSPVSLTPGVYFYRLELHETDRSFEGCVSMF